MDDRKKKDQQHTANLKLEEALSLSKSAFQTLNEIAKEWKGKKELEQVTDSIAKSNQQITELLSKLKNSNVKVAKQNLKAMSVEDVDVHRLVDYLEGQVSDESETISESTQFKSA